MKVYAVGTSCTWYARNNTSFILDDEILFDTPNGSYKQIIKVLGPDEMIRKIKAIFISHFHSDHFFDMHIIATRFMRESKALGRTEKLKVYGPKGILDKLVEINTALLGGSDEIDKNELQKNIDFIEVGNGDEIELENYLVKVFTMDHGAVYSQGYTFTDKKGVVIGFTGDTKDCGNLQNMLSVSNVAFVDVAAIKPARSHLDVNRFAELNKIYPNCKMYAIHTPDETLEICKNNGLNTLDDGDTVII